MKEEKEAVAAVVRAREQRVSPENNANNANPGNNANDAKPTLFFKITLRKNKFS